MKTTDSERFAEMHAKKQRLETAVTVFREGGDVSRVLEVSEFSEVKQVANDAAQNKLGAMLKQTKAAIESEFGQ